jgi:hypothetical protein
LITVTPSHEIGFVKEVLMSCPIKSQLSNAAQGWQS